MNMLQYSLACTRKAKQIKSDYPELGLNQRRDIAAKLLGFKHFRSLQKLHKVLGDEGIPSHTSLIKAGIPESESPMRSLRVSAKIRLSSADTVSSVV